MDEPKLTPDDYVRSLPEKERKAYEIAKAHLGSTFSLEKSNGYIAWISREPTVCASGASDDEVVNPLRPLPQPQSATNKSLDGATK